MTQAEVAANFIHYFQMHVHRGAYKYGDWIVVFGNDAYASDLRSRREVERMREALPCFGITEFAFGLSDDGITWAIIAKPDDDIIFDINDLQAELWSCWLDACDEHKDRKEEGKIEME